MDVLFYTRPSSKTHPPLEDVKELNSHFKDIHIKFSNIIPKVEKEASLDEILKLEHSFSEACKLAQSKRVSLTNLVQDLKTKIYTKLSDLELSLAQSNYASWKEKQNFTSLEQAYNLILSLQNHYYFSKNAEEVQKNLRRLKHRIVEDKIHYHLDTAKQELEKAFATLRQYGPNREVTTAKSRFFEAFRNLLGKFEGWVSKYH